jgi:transmembrane sensor
MSYTPQQRLEAAQWFFDIHDAQEPSPELLQEWLRWLDAAAGNRLAFEAVELAYRHAPVDRVKWVGGPEPGSEPPYDGELPVAVWTAARRARKSARSRQFAIAAMVLAVIGAGVWGLYRMQDASHPSAGQFSTRTGEHMQLMLADGSMVNLGARSHLSVDFSGQARDVTLVSGEAFFQVHKDAQRPFRVRALDGLITAVGTAFDVRATGDHVTVAVSEGVVNVAQMQEAADAQAAGSAAPSAPILSHPTSLHVSRGEQLTFDGRARSPELTEIQLSYVDPAQSARWRDGWLVYRNEALRDVIADVERYTDREVTVADAVPRDLRFTGAVFKDSVVEWVEALPEVFPVAIETRGNRLEVVVPQRSVTATTP